MFPPSAQLLARGHAGIKETSFLESIAFLLLVQHLVTLGEDQPAASLSRYVVVG